ncbi:MAG TPA: TetR/AcrR family transcriptional regulator C-terminal domain-containing protein [Phenylobacterium sp.]|nr:TetR/AcrR family transcriptional regulator C-terminal domain-containing protein [Phenylobacterium sp.]
MARSVRSNPNLTREAVIEAAARVLERDGIEGLTMRAVAAELGVQAPALYWYVANKEALQVALYDHLMAGLVFTPRGLDWREDLREMCRTLRARLLSRRDVARLVPHGFFTGPNSLAHTETVLGLLIGAGLAPRDAFYALAAGFTYVVSWSVGEADLRARPRGERPGLDAANRGLMDNPAYPNLQAVTRAFAGRGDDVDEQFAFGVDCLIAGFERRAGKPA